MMTETFNLSHAPLQEHYPVTSIKPLPPALEDEYEEFVLSDPRHMIFASLRYRSFLQRLFPDAESHYLVATENRKLCAALPIFLQPNNQFGTVANSLPFFGSYGAPMVSAEAGDPQQIVHDLLEQYRDVLKRKNAVAGTIVENPLCPSHDIVRTGLSSFSEGKILCDERIGQITPLPAVQGDAADDETLMAGFHSKTRNSIRKAVKSGVAIQRSSDPADMIWLATEHHKNIAAKGGVAKPPFVFESIRREFDYGSEYELYVARQGTRRVAALLVLFYNRTAEYFVPVVNLQVRNLQPMSLLVFTAMRDAVRRGFRHWNWGGTWKCQHGVYRFKSRWGTTDYPYRYWVYLRDDRILGLRPETLRGAFPFFYVVPFAALESG